MKPSSQSPVILFDLRAIEEFLRAQADGEGVK